MLESAEPSAPAGTLVAGAPGSLAAIEDVPEEEYKKKGIGVLAWIAIGWLVLVVGMAILAPILPIKNPTQGDYTSVQAPLFSPHHLLGSDDSGRDVLSRVIWGAQASLLIAIGSVALGTLIGGALGLWAGFKGGRHDTVLSSSFNIILAFPQLVLALLLVSIFAGTYLSNDGTTHTPSWSRRIVVVIVAVGIVSIPILARITRANALAWSQREFVMAARAQGASDWRVMLREVLPNVLPAMLSIALLGVAIVLILEGSLAIFGLSVAEPSPSWGNMVYSQLSNLNSAPPVWIVPSVLIFATVLAFNYLGDVVRARFDVRESAI
ncbi:MAG TPA: ABC transporter permease [Acidimicrobiia bacterium]|nr:ABC transporter permease [Acidimicrobiia bacterium]